jgi:hypothetical protein
LTFIAKQPRGLRGSDALLQFFDVKLNFRFHSDSPPSLCRMQNQTRVKFCDS